MAENDFDVSIENSSSGSLTPMEETGTNLFLDAYQPSSTASDSQPFLNDASNINKMMRWLNDQYAKSGGNLGNLFPDMQDDVPKIKKMSITGR